MKKSEQLAMNQRVLNAVEMYNRSVHDRAMLQWHKLRSCSAEVAQVGNYHVLRSYNTIVAIIDHNTDTLYDFLRYVYGYTSTSAQHIAKFDHDYGAETYGCAHRLTYKEV